MLREQQLKIERLQKEKNKEKQEEQTMAAGLADKLKNGLLAHLKSDVDLEVGFVCVTWLICMRDMAHLYVWHDAFICVTWLIHMCDVTY